MPTIHTAVDRRRLSGWRRPGGFYLVSQRLGHACSRFPLPVNPRSISSTDVRFDYRFAWLTADQVVALRRRRGGCSGLCPLSLRGERAGVLWIPRRVYQTPGAFVREAYQLGICRAVRHVPRGFEIGKTWVFLAHMGAVNQPIDYSWRTPLSKPGIFHAFVPERIEYIVTGREDTVCLARLEARGITLVHALPGGVNLELFPKTKTPEASSPYEEAPGANAGG